MSESQNQSLETSHELIRWLRMLALPLWARSAIFVVVFAVMVGALALLTVSVFHRDTNMASSAIALLTVSLPILLLVMALVFGQGSDQKLRQLTTQVLRDEISKAIRDNLGDGARVSVNISGCRGEYLVIAPHIQESHAQQEPIPFGFSVELNVYKINVCFWLNMDLPEKISVDTAALSTFRHTFLGAISEGYVMNEAPGHKTINQDVAGVIFFRTMHPDFLMHPALRLYFSQDLSFFVRGMMQGQLTHTHSTKKP